MNKWLILWERLKDINFWKAALARAVWTIAQTFIGSVGAATIFAEVNWIMVASATGLAGVLSIAKSILAGVPEVDDEEILDRR